MTKLISKEGSISEIRAWLNSIENYIGKADIKSVSLVNDADNNPSAYILAAVLYEEIK